MISSIITPVRWYNTIEEQDRYQSDIEICNFELISDKTRLLPFQFRRNKSGYAINKWFLRKACTDAKTAMIDTNNSLFTLDTGYWNKSNFSFVNGKLKSSTTYSSLAKIGIFNDTETYYIKIVVNEIKSSSFTILADTASRNIATITAPGTYTFEFTADLTDEDFTLSSSFGSGSEYVIVEEIQIYQYKKFNVGIGDVDLDISLLTLQNIDSTQDVIQYCGQNLPSQLPCGSYYMILTTEDNLIYYSEVITVKDFIPSQSPYVRLEWFNNCDLGDVIYQSIGGCAYKNRLYINGPISKPEYPFKEEGEEDGNADFNVTFQKWEKKEILTVSKCPEFITDALTAIKLHDTIQVTRPLRIKQTQVLSAYQIKSVECDVIPVFNDMANNVELKMLLDNKIVDSTCCQNISLTSCVECGYTVPDLNTLSYVGPSGLSNLYFGDIEDYSFGLFNVTDGVSFAIAGYGTSGPLTGPQLRITGDVTSYYPVGSYVYYDEGAETGIKKVSAIAYNPGTSQTSIQWAGMLSLSSGGHIWQITIDSEISTNGTVLCVSEDKYYKTGVDGWKKVPYLNPTVADTDFGGGNHSYTVYGKIYAGTFLKMEITIYDFDTAIDTSYNPTTVFTAEDIAAGIVINSPDFPVPINEANGAVTFKFINYDLNCSYGYCEPVTITYSV